MGLRVVLGVWYQAASVFPIPMRIVTQTLSGSHAIKHTLYHSISRSLLDPGKPLIRTSSSLSFLPFLFLHRHFILALSLLCAHSNRVLSLQKHRTTHTDTYPHTHTDTTHTACIHSTHFVCHVRSHHACSIMSFAGNSKIISGTLSFLIFLLP